MSEDPAGAEEEGDEEESGGDNKADKAEQTLDKVAKECGPDSSGAASVGCPAASPAVKKPANKKSSWIEVQLVDKDGKPVAGQTCRIVPPDGKPRTLQTDVEGVAALDSIDPGSCKISFPDLDARSWKTRG